MERGFLVICAVLSLLTVGAIAIPALSGGNGGSGSQNSNVPWAEDQEGTRFNMQILVDGERREASLIGEGTITTATLNYSKASDTSALVCEGRFSWTIPGDSDSLSSLLGVRVAGQDMNQTTFNSRSGSISSSSVYTVFQGLTAGEHAVEFYVGNLANPLDVVINPTSQDAQWWPEQTQSVYSCSEVELSG